MRPRGGGPGKRVTRLWNIASILGWLGVMLACSGMLAPRTLAWLQTLGTLPFELTPRLLQGAALMIGYSP
ncbi:hypothetical protein ACLESO_06585 [Pyxidicoccus sp. 3LG]